MAKTASETKKAITVRLSSQARVLLQTISQKLGISKTAVLELAIRRMGTEEGESK